MMFRHLLLKLMAVTFSMLVFSGHANAFHIDNDFLQITAFSSYQNGLLQIVSNSKGAAAQKFVDDMGKEAISFLSDGGLTQKQKEEKFRRLLRNSFDLKTIGRFALGRNWKAATEVQKREYQKLFEDMVVEVYAARFNDYQGQKFDVSSFRDNGKKDVLVTSYIVPDTGSKVQVDWRVRNKNGQYKIIDVIIEGVSMSLTQRSDFSSVIQRGGGGIEVLLAHLRK